MSLFYNKVRFFTDDFIHLKPFDIVPYQKVIDMYLNTHKKLKGIGQHRGAGKNERPLNSKKENIDKSAFWFGYEPYLTYVNKTVQTKADIISMDMAGVYESWDHFLYLTIPGKLINRHMNSVFENDDLTVAREFLDEVDKFNLQDYSKLEQKYNEKHPEKTQYIDYFGPNENLKWSQDLYFDQYLSIKQKGLLYPICYNNTSYIFKRGTHRAWFLARTESDIPIFIIYSKKNHKKLNPITITTPEHFNGNSLEIDVDIKDKFLSFKFFNKNNGTYSYITS